jgi:hypothetical protein
MKITDEDRKYILNEFLRNISHISDNEYQIRVWIRGEDPEVDDFDETVCHFFDIDTILENYNNFGITDAQYKPLKKLRDEFEIFADKNEFPEEFIDTREWGKIMNLVQDVL